MTLTITIPRLAPGLNGKDGLLRMHWNKRRHLKATWTALILEQRPRGWKALEKATVAITRFSTGRPMDPDNLSASAKLPLDALVRARIIADDSPEHITFEPRYERVRKRAECRTEIIISAIEHKKPTVVKRATAPEPPNQLKRAIGS